MEALVELIPYSMLLLAGLCRTFTKHATLVPFEFAGNFFGHTFKLSMSFFASLVVQATEAALKILRVHFSLQLQPTATLAAASSVFLKLHSALLAKLYVGDRDQASPLPLPSRRLNRTTHSSI
uniref:Uncharacterized protein n=1 Tax=Opuntia streptacantha TaxID=393608 RepID=A0A7C9EIZ3_OPUST